MIDISKINLSLEQVIGNVRLQLLHSKPLHHYVNGKATETIIGTTYEVVQIGGEFEKFRVKVHDIETSISEDEIASATEPLYVEFENASCKLYTDSNSHIQVSVKADSITII